MRVLFIGDVYGAPGLSAAQAYLRLHGQAFDFVIANGENCAGGFGITRATFKALRDAGVDVVTLGNHTSIRPRLPSCWRRRRASFGRSPTLAARPAWAS